MEQDQSKKKVNKNFLVNCIIAGLLIIMIFISGLYFLSGGLKCQANPFVYGAKGFSTKYKGNVDCDCRIVRDIEATPYTSKILLFSFNENGFNTEYKATTTPLNLTFNFTPKKWEDQLK